ncbi:MAG: hypothetical protein ACYDBJ_10500 [Aggregatilineales bacterium]
MSDFVLEQVKALTETLSSAEKAELREWLAAETETEAPSTKKPLDSLYGLWAGVNISDEDIAQARREMWGNFPRDDF